MKLIQIVFILLTITNIIAQWQEGCTKFLYQNVYRMYSAAEGGYLADENGELTFNWETGVVARKVGQREPSHFNIIKFDERRTEDEDDIVLAVSSMEKQDITWITRFQTLGKGVKCEKQTHAMKKKYNGCQNGKFYFFPLITRDKRVNVENGFIIYHMELSKKKKLIVKKFDEEPRELHYDFNSTGDLEMNKLDTNKLNLINVKTVVNDESHSFNMPEVCGTKLSLLMGSSNIKPIVKLNPEDGDGAYMFNIVDSENNANIFLLDNIQKTAAVEIYKLGGGFETHDINEVRLAGKLLTVTFLKNEQQTQIKYEILDNDVLSAINILIAKKRRNRKFK
jgi:hypothetical protein